MNSGLFSFRRVFILTVMGCLALQASAQDSLSLSSPDGKTKFSCQLNEKGILSYTLSYAGQPLILNSSLGVEGWQQSLVLKKVERRQQDTSWKPVYGERALVRDKYREASFVFWRQDQARQQMNLQVRAYDEGLAFRYVFPE